MVDSIYLFIKKLNVKGPIFPELSLKECHYIHILLKVQLIPMNVRIWGDFS